MVGTRSRVIRRRASKKGKNRRTMGESNSVEISFDGTVLDPNFSGSFDDDDFGCERRSTSGLRQMPEGRKARTEATVFTE